MVRCEEPPEETVSMSLHFGEGGRRGEKRVRNRTEKIQRRGGRVGDTTNSERERKKSERLKDERKRCYYMNKQME